jgi:hypothetical protein
MRKKNGGGITGLAISKEDPPGQVRRIDFPVPEIEAGIEKDMGSAVVISYKIFMKNAITGRSVNNDKCQTNDAPCPIALPCKFSYL